MGGSWLDLAKQVIDLLKEIRNEVRNLNHQFALLIEISDSKPERHPGRIRTHKKEI